MHMRLLVLRIHCGCNRNDANEEIISSTCNMEFRLYIRSLVFSSSFTSHFRRQREKKLRERERESAKQETHSKDSQCRKCLIHGMWNASVAFKMKNNTAVLLVWDLLVNVCWEMFILCMDRKYKYKSDSLRKGSERKKENEKKKGKECCACMISCMPLILRTEKLYLTACH